MLFRLHVRNDNRDRTPPLVNLKAVCGPRDIDEPQAAITVMLPNEDRNRPHHLRQRAMPEFGTELTLRVRVKYCVLPGESGSRDRYGALETPQIDDDLEILAIVPLDEWLTVRNGEVELKSWQLPPTMRNEIEAEAHADYEL